MGQPTDPLTERQLRFVTEYRVDGNASAAASRAGYTPVSAPAMGSHLLKDARVQAILARKQAQILRKSDITAERVLEEYRRLAFADARDLHRDDGSLKPPAEWSDDVASQIAGIEVSRTRTSSLGSASDSDAGGTHAGVQIEESTIKVKRWDKVKALEVLAKHTGVLGEGRQALPGTLVDADRVAQLDDQTLAQALELARMLAACIDA